MTTPAQRFGFWLAGAMRAVGLDIDRQRGGGRLALANTLGVSRSTVTRWLEGQSMPTAEQFEPLAAALNVRVIDMLAGAGIVSVGAVDADGEAGVSVMTPEQVADLWGINDPKGRAMLRAMYEILTRPEGDA